MIRIMDGFEQFTGLQGAGFISALETAGYVTTGSLQLLDGANELTKAVAIGSSASDGTLTRTVVSTSDIVSIGFAYRADKARGPIVTIKNLLTLDWTSTVAIGGVEGVALPLLATWYYFEIVVNKAARRIQVYINNGLDLDIVLPEDSLAMSSFEVTWSGLRDQKLIDDFVVVDSNTGKYMDRIGPTKVTLRLPMYDKLTEWSPSEAGNHFSLVDNLPPEPLKFIQSNVSGARDSFLSDTPLPDDGEIMAVGMVVLGRKSDIDGRQLGLFMGDSVVKEHLIEELTMENRYYTAIFEDTPQGNAWSRENLGTNPFGVIVRP